MFGKGCALAAVFAHCMGGGPHAMARRKARSGVMRAEASHAKSTVLNAPRLKSRRGRRLGGLMWGGCSVVVVWYARGAGLVN